MPTKIVIATRNRHKVDEIRAVLGDGYTYLTLSELPGSPKVVEDGATFAANVVKKAVELARWLHQQGQGPAIVLADDSGLAVDALGGAPGVHSARFAALDRAGAENSSDQENNLKLLCLLAKVPYSERKARFCCTIAVAEAGAEPVATTFEGTCEGHIRFESRGTQGFGYDPLFQPEGYNASFAELGEDVKNQISHRAKALALAAPRFNFPGQHPQPEGPGT
jgi:XTP/dITP diphosphohydrolase